MTTSVRLIAGLITASLASLAMQSYARACPLSQLAERLAAAPKGLKSVEVPLAEMQSTEGGFWKVRLLSSGKLHSIRRTDFGETGRREITLVLMDRQNIAIRDVLVTYREPIGSSNPVQVATRASTDYVVCGDIVHVVRNSARRSTADATTEANRLKRSFFEAKELAKYLK